MHTCTGTGQPPVNKREREWERGICSVLRSVCFCTRTFSGFKSQCTCRAVHTHTASGLSVWGTAASTWLPQRGRRMIAPRGCRMVPAPSIGHGAHTPPSRLQPWPGLPRLLRHKHCHNKLGKQR